MIITLDVPSDISSALRRLAKELGVDSERAAVQALRDVLIAGGWHEPEHVLDEDTETEGSG